MTRIHCGGLAFDALRLLRHLGVLGMTLGAQDFAAYRRLFAGSYLLVGPWASSSNCFRTQSSCCFGFCSCCARSETF
jgi:hypothetical protein